MLERFVNHRTVANLLMLILVGFGLYSLPRVQKETFPNFDASQIQITMTYRGASAEDVEQGICLPIEDALDGVQNIKKVECVAEEGSASITVEIVDGAGIATALSDIETAVDAITEFPSSAEDPIITQLNRSDEVMTLAITGPMEPAALKDYCEDLKSRMKHLPMVSLVEIKGFSDRQLRIELKSESLRRLGLSAADVASAIASQNLDVPVGMIESKEEDILIRFVEQRQLPQEIEEIVVSGVAGQAEVRIRDIGRVVDTFVDEEQKAWLDGQRAGIIQINKTRSQDTTRVANILKEFLEREKNEHPQLRFEITNDHADLIGQRLSLLLENAWQGMILVFLVMWLFFNIRLSFWVVMSLPVSFLAALFVLPLAGQTINMMSSVAILMAIGLLMDDGIVIAENFARHMAMGKSSVRAAIDGVKEVGGGVLSSFLTTFCVLGPLLVLEGTIGKVLRVIPMVLITTLGISLIEAFFILPAHLAHSLHHHDPNQPSRLRMKIDQAIDWVREKLFGSVIDWAIRWRYLTIGGSLGLFIFAFALVAGGVVSFIPFPELEGDRIEARVLLPQGTPLSRTEEIVQQINDAVERAQAKFPKQPGDQKLVRSVISMFSENSDAGESGPHVATVAVRVLPPESRVTSTAEFVTALRDEVGVVPDAISVSIGEATGGPAGRDIEILFKDDDLEQANAAAEEAASWLSSYAGVFDLSDDLRRGKQEMRLKLKSDAVGLGFNVQSMASQLSAAFQGSKINDIQVGNDQFEVNVQFAPEDRDTIDEFSGFHLVMSDGVQVPLEAVADVNFTYGWSKIARVDGWRTVTLIGNTDGDSVNTPTLMREVQGELIPKLSEKYPDLQISLGGQAEASSETGSSMVYLFSLGLFGVYAILGFQFESWLEPFIVMFAIPMALIGVVFGHLWMDMDLSMPSLIGYVSLAGIVVNDSILLVLFLKQQRAQGHSTLDSARAASRLRFRAIMLTSITTMVGLLPLTLEQSTQAQVLIPTAVSIVFGLFSSTILVLIVIPCIYVALCELKLIK